MEFHLFIIWEKAQCKKKDIINNIIDELDIIKQIDISWNKERFAENLSRFYGKKLPSGSVKEKECGNGTFTLLVVADKNPKYEDRWTSHGVENVNVNIFDRKELFREWTNDETTPKNYHGSRVHGTNNEQETRHDLMILLGVSPEDLVNKADEFPDVWSENTVGIDGWKNFEQLFYALNQNVKCLVLRNYEELLDANRTTLHGDVDILVDDYQMAVNILGGRPIFKSKFRVHYAVNIAGKEEFFDIRYVGDGYYCAEWERHMLEKRELTTKGVYVMCDEDYKYSLLYHALIHKKQIASDYEERLKNMFSSNETLWIELLKDYMKHQGYEITYPKDLSVNWNRDNSGKRVKLCRRVYNFIGRVDLRFFDGKMKL